MTIEEKQLLLKDLCARLPYGVKCRASYNKFPTTLVDVNVDANVGDDFFIVTVKLEKTGLNSKSVIEDIKPYLRPMSSMTEEEKEEFRTLILPEDEDCLEWGEQIYQQIYVDDFSKVVDWFNAHHFDYHRLIPMDLALEAPEGMYKTE